MTLTPTNVTVQGKRMWLEGADDPIINYVNYHGEHGLGFHIEYKKDLKPAERIEYEQTTGQTAGQQEQAEGAR